MPSVIPTRAALLSTRLGDLDGWHLLVVCPCRSYPRSVPLADLAADRGRRLTIEQVMARLRCKECGQPPASVQACPGDPFAPRAWKVKLR